MDYSKNLLYFTGKGNKVLMLIGFIVALMGFGVVLISPRSAPEQMILGLLMLPVGAALVCCGMIPRWPVRQFSQRLHIKFETAGSQ